MIDSSQGFDGSLGVGTTASDDDPSRSSSTAPLFGSCSQNQPPMANNDTVPSLVSNQVVVIDVLDNDIDSDGGSLSLGSVTVITPPQNGTVSVDEITGQITYSHDGSENLTDTFSYTVEDNERAVSNVGSVIININKLFPNESKGNDRFGYSVSISGDTAISTTRSSIHFFNRNSNGDWIQQPKVVAKDVNYWSSISISGETAIIGASGAAYVFVRNSSGVWVQQTKLLADDGTAYDHFGKSVSISGDTVLIGASGSNRSKGSAYIFVRNISGDWVQQEKLVANDERTRTNFGHSVSISGDIALIATKEITWRGTYSSAYIFIRDSSGNWVQQTELVASDNNAGDNFGFSVAISGDNALVAAPGDDETGSVYLFVQDNSGNWIQKEKLIANDGNTNDLFGHSVSILGEHILIGAINSDDKGKNSGSAYLFIRDNSGNWVQQTKILATDGSQYDSFGHSVSISEDTALIGAYNDIDRGIRSGSIYTYELNNLAPETAPIAQNDSIGSINNADSIAIDVLTNDSANNDSLDLGSVTVVTAPVNGTATVEQTTGQITYFHNGSATTSDFFTYTVADNEGAISNIATVSITINSIVEPNIPPIATNDVLGSIESGQTAIIDLLANDNDSDGSLDLGSITIITPPANGTIHIDEIPTGQITYVHSGSATTSDSFTYTVLDDDGAVSNIATVTIIGNPVASCGSIELDGDNDWVNIPDLALANDFTIEGWFKLAPGIDYRDAIFGQEGSGPDIHFSAGRVRLYAYGIRVTAKTPLLADTWGHIAITRSGSNLTVYVNGVKDATGRWNGSLNIKAIGRGNRGFVKGMIDEVRIWELARTESEITTSYSASVDPNSAGLIGYWGFNDLDQIITDASSLANHGTLGGNETIAADDPIRVDSTAPLTENCAGDGNTGDNPPLAKNDNVGPVLAGESISFAVTGNDEDSDGNLDLASVSITSSPSAGNATVNLDGTITYVSTGTTATIDSLTYTVNDTEGNTSNEAAVSITVIEPEPINIAPVAYDDTVESVEVGGTISFNVTDNDVDSDGTLNLANVVILSAPSDGIAAVDTSGIITYQNTGNIATTDTLSYTITDNQGAVSNIATVSITVIGDSEATPVASDDSVGPVEAGGTITFSVTSNDSGANGDLVLASVVIRSAPSEGVATVDDSGAITYLSTGTTATTDTLTYTIINTEGIVSNEATVSITVIESPIISENITKLLASDGSAGDSFGSSISVSGDTAVIGSPYDDDNGDSSGSAYIFVRNNSGNWTQQAKLVANDGSKLDNFGNSVSISGDTALVGSFNDDDKGNYSGSTYVFIRDSNGNWIQQAKLLANDGSAVDYFGDSVSISGDTALIGASGDDAHGIHTGSAYIFIRNSNGIWSQQAKLLANDGNTQDQFGKSVSISGDTALIGSNGDDDLGNHSGSAYVFIRNNSGNWSLQTKLLAEDGAEGDTFGWSVSLSGNSAVISSYFDDDNGDYSGSAYVFTRSSNGNWSQQEKLLDNNGSAGDGFGMSVSISGRAIIIGSAYPDENPLSNMVHTFIRDNNGNWNQQTTVLPDDIFSIVSISGNSAVIGTYTDNDNGSNSGSFYALNPIDNSDLIIPIITLNESSIVNLFVGDTYIEAGAVAIDDVNGEISDQIIIDDSEVNTMNAGTYTVTYNVRDVAGNVAEEVNRIVIAKQSTISSCKAIELDGSNDWINIPDIKLANDFTIEGWFKLAPGIDYRDAIFGQEGSGPDIHFSAGRVRLYAYGIRVTAKTPLIANTWGHIAITRSGSDLTVYINGVKDATGRWNGLLNIKAIGRGNRGYVKGMMDEIRIWELARTETEIGNSYDQSIDANTEGLLGYWDFNGEDQTVTDLSSMANHGTLGASATEGTDDPMRLDTTIPLTESCD